MVSPIYARMAAPTARARPPKEAMLTPAAPEASGRLAEELPLAPPEEAVEAGLEAAALEGLAELAMGTLVLPAGGATEEAMEGTAGTELTIELTMDATDEATVWNLV